MIVCQCKVVNDARIAEAVADGARTVGAVCRMTGAGSDCGSCVFAVKNLVCEHVQDAAGRPVGQLPPIREVGDAADQSAGRRAS